MAILHTGINMNSKVQNNYDERMSIIINHNNFCFNLWKNIHWTLKYKWGFFKGLDGFLTRFSLIWTWIWKGLKFSFLELGLRLSCFWANRFEVWNFWMGQNCSKFVILYWIWSTPSLVFIIFFAHFKSLLNQCVHFAAELANSRY